MKIRIKLLMLIGGLSVAISAFAVPDPYAHSDDNDTGSVSKTTKAKPVAKIEKKKEDINPRNPDDYDSSDPLRGR